MKIQEQFTHVIALIKQARYNAYKAVNTELINLYWELGKYITQRTESEGWGKSTVLQLADFIKMQEPELKGFTDKNLWRMRQFYETYKGNEKLAMLWREINWTNNLMIFSRAKSEEEREFYLRLCLSEKYSSRELERQINSSVFERVMLGNQKLSAVLRVLPEGIENVFKETYVLDF